MLVSGALDGRSEVGRPLWLLVVGRSVHQGLLTVATAEGMQGLISHGDPVLGIETKKICL